MAFDAAYKDVKCADCGKEYKCTPHQDYYHRPTNKGGPEWIDRNAENGVCESCLLMNNPGNIIHPDKIVHMNPSGTRIVPPPMPPFEV